MPVLSWGQERRWAASPFASLLPTGTNPVPEPQPVEGIDAVWFGVSQRRVGDRPFHQDVRRHGRRIEGLAGDLDPGHSEPRRVRQKTLRN
jgi:hypothetical protein